MVEFNSIFGPPRWKYAGAAGDSRSPNSIALTYIRSTTSMPSRLRPRLSVRAVRSQSSRRLVRSSSVSALQHGAVLEEVAVAAGQLEEVGREVVRAVVGDDAVEGFGELEQGDGEGAFVRGGRARSRDCATARLRIGRRRLCRRCSARGRSCTACRWPCCRSWPASCRS